MTAPAISFERVWKKFRRGEHHDSLRDLLPSLLTRFAARRSAKELDEDREFWALRDISFSVHPGEALGIIGANGAGKSTTLKLLTKILRPTRGRSEVRGRVGALIEVAAGFHPDLTGRENVFLQGSIMGMRRSETARRLDDIVDFAGIAEFIDTPVKRYSSGMNARLGFAIAANLEPDVLIIDEVLSVGDMAFQQRCMERMHRFKRDGVAVAFVSHNLQAVAELCESAVILRRDRSAIQGSSDEVIRTYIQDTQDKTQAQAQEIGIHAQLIGAARDGSIFSPGADLTVRVHYQPEDTYRNVTIGFLVHRSTDNLLVYDGNFSEEELGVRFEKGEPIIIDFNFNAHLTRGQYYVSLHVYHNPTTRFIGYLTTGASLGIAEARTHAGVANLAVRATAYAATGELIGDGAR